jgi:hypothetical protein
LGEFNFDRGGFAAFVMLGGLAVNAGIFILNDFNNRLRGNYNRNIIKSVAGEGDSDFAYCAIHLLWLGAIYPGWADGGLLVFPCSGHDRGLSV